MACSVSFHSSGDDLRSSTLPAGMAMMPTPLSPKSSRVEMLKLRYAPLISKAQKILHHKDEASSSSSSSMAEEYGKKTQTIADDDRSRRITNKKKKVSAASSFPSTVGCRPKRRKLSGEAQKAPASACSSMLVDRKKTPPPTVDDDRRRRITSSKKKVASSSPMVNCRKRKTATVSEGGDDDDDQGILGSIKVGSPRRKKMIQLRLVECKSKTTAAANTPTAPLPPRTPIKTTATSAAPAPAPAPAGAADDNVRRRNTMMQTKDIMRKVQLQRKREAEKRERNQMRNTTGIYDPLELIQDLEKMLGYSISSQPRPALARNLPAFLWSDVAEPEPEPEPEPEEEGVEKDCRCTNSFWTKKHNHASSSDVEEREEGEIWEMD